MSQTPTLVAGPDVTAREQVSSVQRVAFVVAVVSCVPYLVLKLAWISGSTVGIPAGSELLDTDHATTMRLVNALTVGMASAVVVLACMLTRPWGRRVPAWLLLVPTWLACGLLGPILVGFPLQVAANLLDPGGASSPDAPTFLEPWVFTVVYTGFGIQAVALGTLFVVHARRRWATLLRDGSVERRLSPTLPALRVSAVVAALVGSVPVVLQTAWALGATVGLSQAIVDERSRDSLLASAAFVPFAVAAVAGVLLLAFRPGGGLRLPLALAWTGSGTLTGWGAWWLFTSLGAGEPDARPTATMSLVHAAELAAGLVVATAVVHLLAERAHALRSR